MMPHSMYATNQSSTHYVSKYEELMARIIDFGSPARTYLHEKTMAEQML